jgi:hypothetical protein
VKCNPTTMLFEDLTIDEATELVDLATRIVTKGEVIIGNPIFERWCEACGFYNNKLLVMSTVFPQSPRKEPSIGFSRKAAITIHRTTLV